MRPGSRHPGAEELAAYAVGGLDGREEDAVGRHLARCGSCAELLGERFAPAVAVLAESVEQHEPPPELRRSLLATVRREAAAASAAERGADGDSPLQRGAEAERGRRRTGLAAVLLRPAAGVAALSLLAAAGVGYLVAGGEGEPAETVALPQAASGVGGSLVVEDGSATLEMEGMAPLRQGDVYQVWVADPAGVKPSAAFVPDPDGTATAAVPEAAGDAERVLITREAMAGRRTPAGPTVFAARL